MATKKSRKKKSAPQNEHWFLRYHISFWVVVVVTTLLALIVVLRLPQDRIDQKNGTPKTPIAEHPSVLRSKPDMRPEPIPSVTEPQVYEEQENTLETRAKEVDLALIQTLVLMGYDPSGLEHGAVDIRTDHGQEYHFQHLELATPKDKERFATILGKNVHLLVDGGSLTAGPGNMSFTVKVFGVPTHEIIFQDDYRPGRNAVVSGKKARMVIVVDDLGRSVVVGKRLAALTFPITFSVMPHEIRTSQVAAVARDTRNELLLHLPMEPESYPAADPGQGALFVGMRPEQIREVLRNDLAMVSGARGANNHMGSRFTQNRMGVEVVVDFFRARGLFFLDSMTSKDSCVRDVESARGLPYLRRNIFLDNVRDEKAILFQLRKAESLARKRGYAVAIGHPYPETLRALETWQRMRDQNVALVTLKDLL